MISLPNYINEKLVIIPSQVNEKLIINKNYKYNGLPEEFKDNLYDIIRIKEDDFEAEYDCDLLVDIFKGLIHDSIDNVTYCDTSKTRYDFKKGDILCSIKCGKHELSIKNDLGHNINICEDDNLILDMSLEWHRYEIYAAKRIIDIFSKSDEVKHFYLENKKMNQTEIEKLFDFLEKSEINQFQFDFVKYNLDDFIIYTGYIRNPKYCNKEGYPKVEMVEFYPKNKPEDTLYILYNWGVNKSTSNYPCRNEQKFIKTLKEFLYLD